jgi:PAS domain S-box-containing protein
VHDATAERNALRDIVALATLPAIWQGAAPLRIAETLAAALFTTLGPEFVYVSLGEDWPEGRIDVAQTGRYEVSPALAALMAPRMARWMREPDADEPLVIAHPCATGLLRIVGRPIGHGGRRGVVAVAFYHERDVPPLCDLALNIVTTQASIATENARLLKSLEENTQRLKAALAAANTGTFRWDIGTDALSWDENLDRLFGLPAGQTVRTLAAFIECVHPDDRSSVIDLCRQCAEKGTDFELEFRVLWPDGTQRWLHDKGRVHRDGDGRLRYMTGACVDITRLKEAQAEREHLLEAERAARGEAERANRLKDEFLATVSHELRTPLNAIVGWSHILRMRGLQPDIAEGLAVIDRNARAQTQLIDDLLDMSRIVSGKFRLELRETDVIGVVDAALDALRPAAQAKKVLLGKACATSVARVQGDGARLQQVVWNLLSNAIKFTPSGGSVTVMIDASGGEVMILVHDTGVGIAPEFLPHVFDRFRQADSATTRSFGGLGVGLAIVKSIVDMHGGTVRARSPGVGRGSSFEVRLPACLVGASSMEHRREMPVPDSDASLEGTRVLVIDDEADVRDLLRRLLEDRGASVMLAGDCADGMRLMQSQRPHVLVSDIGLPGEDGYSLMRRIRRLESGEGVDVQALALTAFARPEDRERALEAGFQAHMRKPFDPAELIAAVAALAARSTNPRPAPLPGTPQ